jgi:hypothetical protein
LLARFDAGKSPLQRALTDLRARLAEAAEDTELLVAPRGLEVSS